MNLKPLFNPRSVAFIGATDRKGSVGLGICKNLLEGKNKRKTYFVNPNREKVLGIKTFDKITDIRENVDLAVIGVPAGVVNKVARQAEQKGVKAAVVVSAGFSEAGKEGEKRQKQLKKIFKKAVLVGPNCLGVISPKDKLNASFAPLTPKKGGIGFISQSGALVDGVVDASLGQEYGFSKLVSLGNAAGLKIHDFLNYFDKDKETRVTALYIEGVKQGRELLKTLKNLTKPVVALKAGGTEEGQKAVSSHTGSLAGKKEVYSAVFKEAGVFEVESLTELFGVAKALSWQPRFKGKVGIVTNAGGPGVLAVDYCSKFGLKLADLEKGTIKGLERSGVMHPSFSRSNPLDIVGDASPQRYEQALKALLGQDNIKALMVIQTLQIMTKAKEDARMVVELHKKHPEKPVVTCFMGGRFTEPSVKILEKQKIPNYKDPLHAVLALKSLEK